MDADSPTVTISHSATNAADVSLSQETLFVRITIHEAVDLRYAHVGVV